MNVNDKIKQILIDKNLSPSVFADEIGVQRSSISHILSGRNRPSFDIIQKVIRRFPDLGYDWIMEDENQDYSIAGKPVTSQPNQEANQTTIRRGIITPSNQTRRSGITSSLPEPSQIAVSVNLPLDVKPNSSVNRAVERILIFYTDGTFREYKPADSK